MNFTIEDRNSGPINMARDSELLSLAEQGSAGCRVYQWDGVWVSLGHYQKPDAAIQPGFNQWVMRPTGGRAVLHGHDVTVGLAVPLASLGITDSKSIKAVYRAMVAPLIAALNNCGVPAELAERTRFVKTDSLSADCFALSSPNDVVHRETGKKLCGCALRVTDHAALVQASIPFERPLREPDEVIVGGVALQGELWDCSDFAQKLSLQLTRDHF